jgi:hypothetical protein
MQEKEELDGYNIWAPKVLSKVRRPYSHPSIGMNVSDSFDIRRIKRVSGS